MTVKKKKYTPKTFESACTKNDTSANIYESMLTSSAYTDMTKNQRFLYVCMKAQYYGKRKPEKDFPDMDLAQGSDKFYFPFALAKKYKIYTDNNKRQFYKDVQVIVEHGFIEVVSSGKQTHIKNIYKFSDKWRIWKTEK